MRISLNRNAQTSEALPPDVNPNLRAGVCVGAAIFHKNALLLLRRIPDFPGLWELPGGSVEAGEKLESALAREVREETGLTVSIGRPFCASTFEADGQEGRRVTIVAIEYLCEANSKGPISLSPTEHDAHVWVNEDDLPKYPLVPAFAGPIPLAFQFHRTMTGLNANRVRGRT